MRIRQPSRISHSRCASPNDALITAAVLAVLAASVPAQRQFDELRKRGLAADSEWTRAVALGDVVQRRQHRPRLGLSILFCR